MKEGVHKAVDCDERRARGHPPFAGGITGQQQFREDHRPELKTGPGNVDQRLDQGAAHASGPIISTDTGVGSRKPSIDPTSKVVVANVPHKSPRP